ncbi:MAG: DUF2723 domain-containing protein [Ignavibacteriaceae bacterium]|nr:DUF2723 domain-containing protein [Ignavibacteriaceae bacterium]
MNLKLLHRIFTAAVFLISLIVLFLTVQPSVSFWDCGEFIAASYYLQVPHPPGTPFFLLIGRIFSMIPFAENIGLRVNIISVLSSALAVTLLYLIAVKLINNYKGNKPGNISDAISTYFAAAIGALSFSFSDTFWFNGVEAEVYAFSTFLFALVTYLMMRWQERADSRDNEKYILMIAYLVGLSTGVHLMSVLAVVPVVMVIMFRKYLEDEESLKKTAYIFIAHVAIILLIAVVWWAGEKSATPPMMEDYQEFDSKFKIFIIGISVVIMGIFWKKIFNRNSFYLPLIIGGIALFFTYPGIVKFLPAIMTALGGDNITLEIFIFILILAGLGYGVYYSVNNNKPTLNLVLLSIIFILVGFTTFSMVIIRSNQNPPMNENEPNDFTELVSYLNREQYGDFPTFKRRYATEPHQMVVYNNYSSDLDFFYKYQMNHMMTRYLLWNYAGREGWTQDDGANMAPLNPIGNIIGKIISVNFAGGVKDSLFGIPLLLGIFGIIFHFRKDWKMASVFMIMFILMGYLTAFYQNQQEPQPRERDYFYVGAFFVFSVWIALGVRGLIDLLQLKVKNQKTQNTFGYAVLFLAFVFVPVRMLQANYYSHDRSKNWVPWDYSYNLLQSCAPNAVLFTNGDNDTFPLWYLQDVEGIRRDVKIANLSLLNTNWYIKQLKGNDPYNVGVIKIRMSDAQIDQLRPTAWEPRDITVPLPKSGTDGKASEMFQQYNLADSSAFKDGFIRFRMNPTLNFGDVNAIRVQDIMVREIVEANNWERPIYFAVTCSDDSKIGMQDYLRMEGMALRLVPEKRKPGMEFVNPEILEKQLTENPGYSKDFKPGFKFRGLNDPEIFFDDNHRRMIQNYRNAFIRLAIHYLNTDRKQQAALILDEMERKLPKKNLGMEFGLLYEVGNLYLTAGAQQQYNQYASEIEKIALQKLADNPSDVQTYYNPYRILLDVYENTKQYKKLIEVWQKIQVMYPNDPNVKSNIEKYQKLADGKDTAASK